MRIGVGLAPYSPTRETVALAKRTEEAGADFVWISDHYRYRHMYPVLAEIAGATKKAVIGPGVTNPYLSHPAVIAAAMATLSEISGGRAALGISTGDQYTLEAMGVEQKHPAIAIREAFDIITGLFSGESVDYSGKVFSCKGARLNFKPPSSIPVYIGGRSPLVLKLAGSVASGVLINAAHASDVKECIEYVNSGAKDSGRDLKDVDVAVYAITSIDSDEEQARERVRTVAALLAASMPVESLERHGASVKDVDKVREILASGGIQSVGEAVSNEMIDAFTISGTMENLFSRVKEFEKLGVTQMILSSPIGSKPEEVLKSLREELL